jgi:hypothetical protein
MHSAIALVTYNALVRIAPVEPAERRGGYGASLMTAMRDERSDRATT